MLKKVIVGTLFIGLTAMLIIGASYRTMEKSQDTASAAGQGRGRSDASVVAGPVDQHQGQGQGQTQVAEWLTLTGSVAQIDESALIISHASGEAITVEGRPWRFALEQGFTAAVGDTLSVTGFYEGDVFEVAQLANASRDQAVTIRQENGRPLWAGGGRPSALPGARS
jgi:hypothetical protein